jgi:hypothetical protein
VNGSVPASGAGLRGRSEPGPAIGSRAERDGEARLRWELLDEQAQAAILAGPVTEVWMPPTDGEPIDPRTLARERALERARREKRNGIYNVKGAESDV